MRSIWLEDAGTEPSWGGSYRSGLWYIFSPSGELAAKLVAPMGVFVCSLIFSLGGPEIGADYILAQRNNADGAPGVQMHPIHKQGLGGK
jgi:hypothetical protein